MDTRSRRAPHGYEINRWEDLLNHTDKANRPKVVFEIWASNAQTWERGPAGKVCRVWWQDRGYVSRFRRVDATQVGGAIQQVWFVAVRIQEDWASYWNWPEFEKDSSHVRSIWNAWGGWDSESGCLRSRCSNITYA
jgi:hypothetical protein